MVDRAAVKIPPPQQLLIYHPTTSTHTHARTHVHHKNAHGGGVYDAHTHSLLHVLFDVLWSV